jgi:hypothetical protein
MEEGFMEEIESLLSIPYRCNSKAKLIALL